MRAEKKHIERKLELQERKNAEIRDVLAIERTKFANERTFLAYIRTALAMVGGGLVFIDFFEREIYKWMGGFLAPLGMIMLVFAIFRFRKKQLEIRVKHEAYTPTTPFYLRLNHIYHNWLRHRRNKKTGL